jgi:aspartate kinase
LVVDEDEIMAQGLEKSVVSGIAYSKDEAKITVTKVADRPGVAAAIFGPLAAANINVDMIVQNVSAAATGRTDVTFTCPQGSVQQAMAALQTHSGDIGFEALNVDDQIAKISLVGAGMRSHPGVSATFFSALADASVNVEMISTSEIRISIVTRVDDAQRAAQAIHSAFGLDADGEAVVYAGTGR